MSISGLAKGGTHHDCFLCYLDHGGTGMIFPFEFLLGVPLLMPHQSKTFIDTMAPVFAKTFGSLMILASALVSRSWL